MNKMLGKTLDKRYRIIRLLGKGGFGETYLTEDIRRIGRHCVVKRLQPVSRDPHTLEEAKRLFDSEAITLDKLGKEHDQIPDLLDYFEENQEYYLVQELVEGRPLNAVISAGVTEAQVVSILQDVLGVLRFVHQSQVIHRDIKPSNLMQRHKDDRMMLIDFGAVKQVHTQFVNAEGQTTFSRVIGTPGYMPNEQGTGKPRFCSDIYALGMVAIEALTRIPPNQLPEDPITGEIIWREQAHVSPQLAAVLEKMVRSHFRDRYQSADEVLDDLKNLPDSGDVNQTYEFPSEKQSLTVVPTTFASFTSTPKKSLIIGVSTAAALALITGYAYLQRWQAYQGAQKALEKVRTLEAQKKYPECITLAKVFPQKYLDLYSADQTLLNSCQLARDQAILAQAKSKAKINDLEAAIQQSNAISPDSLVYDAAQSQALVWRKTLLQTFLQNDISQQNKGLAPIMAQIKPKVQVDVKQVVISYDNSSYVTASGKAKEKFLRILTVVFMEFFRGNKKENIPSKYTEFEQLIVYPQQGRQKAIITTEQWNNHVKSRESAKQLYPSIQVINR